MFNCVAAGQWHSAVVWLASTGCCRAAIAYYDDDGYDDGASKQQCVESKSVSVGAALFLQLLHMFGLLG